MPAEPILFGPNQRSGYEPLGGASPLAVNVVIDGTGTVRRRPGITTYDEAPSTVIDSTGISGLHMTNGGSLYAVSLGPASRKIYRVGEGTAVDLSVAGDGGLAGTSRPIFAETDALLAIAGGGEMQKVVLATSQSSRMGGSPPICSHVTANSLRLLANDLTVDTSKIRFSGISTGTADFSGHEDWSVGGVGQAGFVSADARPDPVRGLYETTNEVFANGATNLQVFVPDTQDVYATVSTREYGLIAPYSPIKVDQAYAWFDHRRRFVVTDGRTFEIISEGMGETFDTIVNPSDCFGYRVHEGPIDCMVWTFPTDGRTFAYQRNGGWAQWQGFDASSAQFKQFGVGAHTHDMNTDDNIVGTVDGKVGLLEMGLADDLGERIVAQVDSGFINRGTDRYKMCVAVRLTFRRGEFTTTPAAPDEPIGFLEFKDAPGEWEMRETLRLGANGDTEPVIVLRGLGTYRRRAWRFTFSGDTDLVLASVEEEFEILEQ